MHVLLGLLSTLMLSPACSVHHQVAAGRETKPWPRAKPQAVALALAPIVGILRKSPSLQTSQ